MSRAAVLVYPLASLLAEPPGSTRTYAITGISIPIADDVRLAEPIDGELRVARTNRGVIVHTSATTALDGTCARCLGEAVTPIRLEIDEEVLPAIDLASGQPLDRAAEPDVLRLTDHHELDMEPILREAVSLAEPIAPLCRPDCPGLCIVCGARLADGHPAHDEDDLDPRLAALRGFRVDDEAENG